MSRELITLSSQHHDQPPAVAAATADVGIEKNAPEGWPADRRALHMTGDPADGHDQQPVQRPNFTAIVNASRSMVHVHGELNVFTLDLLRGAIDHHRAVGHDHITVDLADLVRVDATAMRELGRLQRAMGTDGAVVIFLDAPRVPIRHPQDRGSEETTVRPPSRSLTTAAPSIADDPAQNGLRAVPTTGLGAATQQHITGARSRVAACTLLIARR